MSITKNKITDHAIEQITSGNYFLDRDIYCYRRVNSDNGYDVCLVGALIVSYYTLQGTPVTNQMMATLHKDNINNFLEACGILNVFSLESLIRLEGSFDQLGWSYIGSRKVDEVSRNRYWQLPMRERAIELLKDMAHE